MSNKSFKLTMIAVLALAWLSLGQAVSAQAERYDISGTVFYDYNQNGTYESDSESGMAGWTVRLDRGCDGTLNATTTTATDGSYTFANQAAGECYAVSEVLKADWQATGAPGQITSLNGNVSGMNFGNIYPSMTWIPDQRMANGVYGQPYTWTYTVVGSTGPFTIYTDPYDLPSHLPTGLSYSINQTAGSVTISGTPIEVGEFSFHISARDRNGATAGWGTIFWVKAIPTLTLTSTPNPSDYYGQAVTFTVTGSGIPGYPLNGTVNLFADVGIGMCQNLDMSTGQVTCVVTWLMPGAHVITASYMDNFPNYAYYERTTTLSQTIGPASFSISGTAFNDADADWAKDAGEAGIAGQAVFLDMDCDGGSNYSTATGADGAYAFNDMEVNRSYCLSMNPITGWRQTATPMRIDALRSNVTGKDFGFVEELQPGPTFTVNCTAPTTDHACTKVHCTLREAIEAANNDGVASTIELAAGAVYPLKDDVRGGAGLPFIESPITLNGHGATIQRSTEAGAADIRMAVVASNGLLTLNRVIVRDFTPVALHGGVIYNNGTVTINGSTLYDNSALRSGAVHINSGTVTIVNSTFYSNTATQYGGAILNFGALNVRSSTFAGNSAAYGGAIFQSSYGSAILKNTLMVKGTSGANCYGALASESIANMADDSSCGSSATAKTAAEIKLASSLASNGGSIQTMALDAGSAAIDQGNAAACKDSLMASGGGWIDQRGYGRFADGNGDGYKYCDVGAYEYNATSGPSAPAPDETAPATRIVLTLASPDGSNGWYRGPVTVLPQARDTGSGVIELRCALDPATAPTAYEELPEDICPFLAGAPVSDDGMHTMYMAAMDLAGNKSAIISKGFQIDATAPALTCPDPGPILLNSGDQAVGPAGVDASVSGLDEAASTLSGIVTTEAIGLKSLTFTAFDLAGNSASQECTYNVIYDFGGYYPPVEGAPALNAAEPGSAIPLKFSLAGDQGLDILAAGYPTVQQVECKEPFAPVSDPSATKPAGKSGLSYDPLTGWYNYVWKTDKAWAGTCRALTIQLIDGTQHVAYLQFQ